MMLAVDAKAISEWQVPRKGALIYLGKVREMLSNGFILDDDGVHSAFDAEKASTHGVQDCWRSWEAVPGLTKHRASSSSRVCEM
eukprot:5791034-Amphidinium_carterae.1